MMLSSGNQLLIKSVAIRIAEFESGELDIVGLYSAVSSAVSLLENDGSGLAEAMRRADADLELIMVTVLAVNQEAAARKVLQEHLGPFLATPSDD